ncbi:MAG TPA: sulfurtransferase [Thioalkalivibrio sp.]|nr:sulfurtransferase [Thioalkalivibrio sp.]
MRLTTLFLILAATVSTAQAAPAPADPARQTPWGLYLDAREAHAMKTGRGDAVLFIDVRDPIEIMFTGFTDVVDINIPILLANPSKWHPSKPVFAMEENPDFEPMVAAALAERGLDKSTPVILMCRSGGERGAPSARALHGKGYEQVYVVVDGFEGGTLKEGERAGWRLVNGWKNSGLPWSYQLNREKMYFRP